MAQITSKALFHSTPSFGLQAKFTALLSSYRTEPHNLKPHLGLAEKTTIQLLSANVTTNLAVGLLMGRVGVVGIWQATLCCSPSPIYVSRSMNLATC
jgi:hypothetical protein